MYTYHTHFKSNNYNERASGAKIEFLIFHYTACDLITSLRILRDDASLNPVSAHYLIDEEGEVYVLVDERYRAWHAGVSAWQGLDDINSRSVGIELVHPEYGPEYRPFSSKQMKSLIYLSQEILARHPIPAHQVLGHSDIAPLRKVDPGPFFDWLQLANHGIGLYPDFDKNMLKSKPAIKESGAAKPIEEIQRLLSDYGYLINITGTLDTETETIIRAFQMHFWPQRIDGRPSRELKDRLNILIHAIKENNNLGFKLKAG